jgi:phenylalanyl-tRNA synthetase beta chain
MQFPESWLREFCNPPLSTEVLAKTLTMAGMEVESLTAVAPPFSGVVVGSVVAVEQHPNADKLRVCTVDVGQAAPLQIVCGASNARVGIKVPCALVGAALPPGDDGVPFAIKVGKLRGVDSFGMLCSARELKLSDDHAGLLELAPDAPIGQDIRVHLNLDDAIFTLKLTPNLSHCLSVFGIAREVSALTGAPLCEPRLASASVGTQRQLAVKVSAADLCGRFSGRVIENVNPKASTPAWMVERLARCGQRSVTPLVDISNYVMFELGRPSHIFDLDKIQGGLDVRWGRVGESLKLLNGATISLDDKVGVIADDVAVESLAGIMGGDATAVSDSTRHVYVEAAFWWPQAVAGRSRRFNFSTDAGHRFERGVDAATTVAHLERITQLVLDICGGQAGPIGDVQSSMPAPRSVSMRVTRAQRVLGMPLTVDQCADALRKLSLPLTVEGDTLTVAVPSYRFDLAIEEDLIEEVVRMIGFDQLPTSPPQAPITPRWRKEAQRGPFQVRHQLADLGYQETINYSFVDEKWEADLAGNASPIKLLNPIASHMGVMRSSLLAGLVNVLKFNLDRRLQRVRLFEVGRVFARDDSVPDSDRTVKGFSQPMRVAGLAYGGASDKQWGVADTAVDFYDAKGDVERLFGTGRPTFVVGEHPAMHPGRCAQVVLKGLPVGFVGELHPKWRQSYDLPKAPVLFELSLDAVLHQAVPRFEPVSKYPTVQRDVALMVGATVSYADLMEAVWSADTQGLLIDAVLFDIYLINTGDGERADRSFALRLLFNHREATLTDAAVDGAVQSVLARLSSSLGVRLR